MQESITNIGTSGLHGSPGFYQVRGPSVITRARIFWPAFLGNTSGHGPLDQVLTPAEIEERDKTGDL